MIAADIIVQALESLAKGEAVVPIDELMTQLRREDDLHEIQRCDKCDLCEDHHR